MSLLGSSFCLVRTRLRDDISGLICVLIRLSRHAKAHFVGLRRLNLAQTKRIDVPVVPLDVSVGRRSTVVINDGSMLINRSSLILWTSCKGLQRSHVRRAAIFKYLLLAFSL